MTRGAGRALQLPGLLAKTQDLGQAGASAQQIRGGLLRRSDCTLSLCLISFEQKSHSLYMQANCSSRNAKRSRQQCRKGLLDVLLTLETECARDAGLVLALVLMCSAALLVECQLLPTGGHAAPANHESFFGGRIEAVQHAGGGHWSRGWGESEAAATRAAW